MKTKLFVDFDGTIVNSIKSFCDCYNKQYKYKNNFKKSDWKKVNKWNFNDQCPLLDNAEEIFDSTRFFKILEFFENAKEVLYELHKKYEIFICSIGNPLNIAQKSLWIQDNLRFINNVILIKNSNCIMNKSIVNMKGGIIIDDVSSNLITSNASFKFCYGKIAEWNDSWNGERLLDWNEAKKALL